MVLLVGCELIAGVDRSQIGGSAVEAGVDTGEADSGGASITAESVPLPPDCADTSCDINATCEVSGAAPTCTCKTGFFGDGKQCSECATCGAGQFARAACSATTDTVCAECTTCPDGQFATAACAGSSDTTCSLCSGACPDGQYEIAACSATSDRVCTTCTEACAAGQFESATCGGASNRVCTSCSPVQSCTGVLTCTDASNSRCTACGAGTYLADGRCEPCSASCGVGQFESAACGATTDRMCDACTAVPGCVGAVTCTNANDSQCASCGAGSFLASGACQACATTCAPGQFESTACGGTTDRACTACTAIANCASGLTCTTAANQQCATCAAGHYLVNGAADTCAACSTCGQGQYVSAACAATADAECSACDANCVACSGPNACTACAQGYVVNAGVCVAANPTIQAIAPNNGPAGTTITITGTNFRPGATVTVGGSGAVGVYVDGTTMTATVPALATGAQNVVVTNTDTTSVTSVGGFTVTASNNNGPPTVTGVTPVWSSFPGTPWTVTGTNFRPGVTVTVNGIDVNGTLIDGNTIDGLYLGGINPGTYDLVVTNADTSTVVLPNAVTIAP